MLLTENLTTLKIHKLSQEQYNRELEAGNIDETALYLTPDEEYVTKSEFDSLREELELLKSQIALLSEVESYLNI